MTKQSRVDRKARARSRFWRWVVMGLALALAAGAVATLGDRGFVAAAAATAGGVWLSRRLTSAARANAQMGRMTTDPWQEEEAGAAGSRGRQP